MSVVIIHPTYKEELIRSIWPFKQPSESSHHDVGTWEILNPNSNDHQDGNRHWFKQNYTGNNRLSDGTIVYH